MDLSFAIVGEGKTDQVVLESILIGVFSDKLDPGNVVYEQPPLDESGSHQSESWGNWLNVVKYLEGKAYREAFQFHPFLVVQIDSDICEEPGLEISKTGEGGIAHSAQFLAEKIREKLSQIIGKEDMDTYRDRFLFAIGVHSLECWLLPLYGKHNEASNIMSCKVRVDRGLKREKMQGLNKSDIRTYHAASSPYRRFKVLSEVSHLQQSFDIFVKELITLDKNLDERLNAIS